MPRSSMVMQPTALLVLLCGFASAATSPKVAPTTLVTGFRILHTDPAEFVSALRTSTPPTPIATRNQKTATAIDKASRLSSLIELRHRSLSGGSIFLEIVPNIQRLGTASIDGLTTSIDLSQMTHDENGYHYVMRIKIPSGYIFNGVLHVEKHPKGALLTASVENFQDGIVPAAIRLLTESFMSALGLSDSLAAAEKSESMRER